MNANRTPVRHQQRRLRSIRKRTDNTAVFNLLTDDALFDRVEQLLPEHRERLFPPTETLSMFVAQLLNADQSCQQIVDQAAVYRVASGLSACSSHTGAYCRARQRLPLDMVRTLARELGGIVEAQAPTQWHWQERRVLLVDGTCVSMPDTPANQAEFPQQSSQLPGLGFPICRIVGITCLASGALLNAAIGRYSGKGGSERSLLRQIQDTFQAGDIVLGDGFYPTYFFLADMQKKGVDILMEQEGNRRRSTDFRKGQRLGERDHLIVIEKPKRCPYWMSKTDYQATPESITVREFRAGGKIMVTTITKTPKAELKTLYHCRWQVELDLRDLKQTMGMDILSCKGPQMIIKEIWAYLLGYNMICWIAAQAALRAGIMPRQISFKHCVQIWTTCLHYSALWADPQFEALLALVAQQRVGKRPGRIEPRAVKRRPKTHPILTEPRQQARQHAFDFGHPKKVK